MTGLRASRDRDLEFKGGVILAVIDMARNIKELFPNYVVMIKIGTFYEVYNDDANIISYLLKYKIKNLSSSDRVCGFSLGAINKVLYILEGRNINYIMIDRAHNYEEESKINYKKKNKYYEVLDIANEYIDRMNRIDKISNYLIKDSSKLIDIENILYER